VCRLLALLVAAMVLPLLTGCGIVDGDGRIATPVPTSTPTVSLGPTQTQTSIPTATSTATQTPPPFTPTPAPAACHPSYSGACLLPDASDYDCVGGVGNGPYYTGQVRVTGPDVFELDADGNGIGCDSSSPTLGPAPLSPEETVALFYTLIDQRQFGPAYSLYSSGFRASQAPSFEAWQAGYATTDDVAVEYLRRASGTGTVVEVSILARDIVNGQSLVRRFAGTWSLVQEQGAWRLDAARIQVQPAP
jgi:hypothetical protein